MIVVAGVIDPGYSEHFELHAFQLFEGQILEQSASSCSEVMLNRIGKREEIAAGVLESVAERNQFLPAIDCDEPAVLQIAPEFFRLDAKIDNVGVGPDKRVKRLDVGTVEPSVSRRCTRTVPVSPNSTATIRGVGSAPKSSVFFSNSIGIHRLRRFTQIQNNSPSILSSLHPVAIPPRRTRSAGEGLK